MEETAIDLAADGASANFAGLIGIKSLLFRFFKLLAVLNYCQPERCDSIKNVACSTSMAFNDRLCPKLFQTRSRRNEILMRVSMGIGRLHVVAVADPSFFPALWTIRYFHTLTVQRDQTRGRFADNAPRYIFLNLS